MKISITNNGETTTLIEEDERGFKDRLLQITAALIDPSNTKTVVHEYKGKTTYLPALFLKNSVIKHYEAGQDDSFDNITYSK